MKTIQCHTLLLLAAAFSFLATASLQAQATAVSNVIPNAGTIAGGTQVTITGSFFGGATAVSFGGTAAVAFSVVNDNTITATAPAHAAGVVSVLVTSPSGTNGANTLFTYLAPGAFSNFMDATTVIGQANFTDQVTTASQSVTPSPSASAISATGKLAIGEQNGRVLIWNRVPASNGVPADVVVGKPNFTSTTGGTTASLMSGVWGGVTFSPDGSKLIVCDWNNNRVLIWNTVPTVNGAAADVVIGQTDFVTATSGTSASKLNGPNAATVTPGGKLLITETGNNRVLVFNSIPTVNGASADVVIGQPNMTTNTSGNTAANMSYPYAATLTADGKFLVADLSNDRVLVFNSVPTSNGAAANVVIGQTTFGSSSSGVTQATMSSPVGVAISPAGKLAISEYINRRVLIYNTVPTANGAAADAVLGQPNFTSNTSHNGGVSARSMAGADSPVFTANGRLIVPSASSRRATIFGVESPEHLSSGGPIVIPTGGPVTPYPSSIAVSGVTGTVTSVRVKLNGLTHTWPGDVDVFVMSPSGAVSAVLSGAGEGSGLGISNVNLVFDDTAGSLLPQSTLITSGTYRPTDYQTGEALPPGGIGTIGTNLTALADGGVNGAWKLFVTDDFVTADGGSLTSWAVEIQTSDYTVSTTGGALVVTDVSGNGETLTVSEPSAGNIKFAVTGRTFSVNGGPNIYGDSGNLSRSGITSITVNAGAGADVVNVGAFTGTLPSFTLNGGVGDDTVNLNGDIAFASDANLDVDLQNDDATPGTDIVNLGGNANLITTGNGTITVKVSKNFVANSGSSLDTLNGALSVEANQQAVPTSGLFMGVSVNTANLRANGTGILTVKGKGGTDAGSNHGVFVDNGGQIIGGTMGTTVIEGTSGASTSGFNYGVGVQWFNGPVFSSITTLGSHLSVTGIGGGIGASDSNRGVSIVFGGSIRAGGAGTVTVAGTGGSGTGGFNHGVVVNTAGQGTATITSSGGSVQITGTEGVGGIGIYLETNSPVTTATNGGNLTLIADSMSLFAPLSSNAASTVTLRQRTNGQLINLGAADSAGTLGLTDAELDQVSSGSLVIGDASSGAVTISQVISPQSYPTLDVQKGIAFSATGGFASEITSASVFEKLKANGAITIDPSATLTATAVGGFVPSFASAFTLIDNVSASTTTGSFSGKPEAATVQLGGVNRGISYIGGTGNDVVLSYPNTITELTNAVVTTIPAVGNATPFPSTITVSGVTGTITAVRVKLNGLTHTFPDDVDVFLMSPSGAVCAVLSDAGGNSANALSNVNLVFDDTAATVIPDSTVITSGTYRPANYGGSEALPPGGIGTIGTNLTALAAGGVNGDWKLFVSDDADGDSGSIASWSLVIETQDYSVSTADSVLVVTDTAGNGDTLTLSEPAAGFIKFSAAGRSFNVNGGANTVSDSGSISLAGITSIVVNAAGGTDIINVGAFTTALPSLTVNGGVGNDTVNLNGDITFAVNANLDLDLQNDDAAPGTDSVNVASNANLLTSGTGTITVKVSKNVALNSGSSFETVDGGIIVEANQQAVPTTGVSFRGIYNAGGTLTTTGAGNISIKGKGGTTGTSNVGVAVSGAVSSTSSAVGAGTISLTGAGGSGASFDEGVGIATGSVSSVNGDITITGTGGSSSGTFDTGVRMASTSSVNSSGTAAIVITGTGGSGVNENYGLSLGGAGAVITSSASGNIILTGTPGSGATTSGVQLGLFNPITITSLGTGNVTLIGDQMQIVPINAALNVGPNTVTLRQKTNSKPINLGAADSASTLGLTDAELDCITADTLVIGDANSGALTVSQPLSRATTTALRLNSGSSLNATSAGTDVTMVNATDVLTLGAPLLCPITGAAADSGYPQLNVAGAIDLNNVALNLTGTTFAGAAGNSFTLVDNDGADAITGIFAGLAEGAYLPWPGSASFVAQISYAGGTGNDVVITLIDVAASLLVSTNAEGTLRQALAVAAAHPGADTLTFAAGLSGRGITLTSKFHIIDSAPVILDASALSDGLTLSGNNVTSIFFVEPGSDLTLIALTLTGGNGIHNRPGWANGYGGAIANYDGTLTLTRCTFMGNNANLGGAVDNEGTMTATACTFYDNTAADAGGAITNLYTAVTLTHCTLSGNSTDGDGGAIYLYSGLLTLKNSIVAGNSLTGAGSGADIYGSGANVTREGNNLIQDFANDGGTQSGPAAITDAPLLGPLASNGGPTQTMALLLGSPARDASSSSLAMIDQRGLPVVGTADIGAYENQVGAISDVSVVQNTPIVGPLLFTVGTVGTLSATSSNTTLLPNANITLSGAGPGRFITLAPANGQFGTAIITISNSTGGGNTTFMLTVRNFGTLAFAPAGYTVSEGGLATLTINRTVGTGGEVRVTVATSTATAAPATTATAADYTPKTQQLIFADGEASKTFTVQTTTDALVEANETFFVTLSAPLQGAVIGSADKARVTIIDASAFTTDVTPPTITLTTPGLNAFIGVNTGSSMTILGTSTDAKGVEKVEYRLLPAVGIPPPFALATLATPGGTNTSFTGTVTPVTGANSLEIKATDFKGNNKAIIQPFKATRPLQVILAGAGTVTTGFAGTSFREVGKPLTITATPSPLPTATGGHVFDGWQVSNTAGTGITPLMLELPKLTFTFTEGLVITAKFIPNPFTTALVGTFNGLALPSASLPAPSGTTPGVANVGLLSNLVLGTKGTFTGSLKIDGATLAMPTGSFFDNIGVARFIATTRSTTHTFVRTGKPDLVVALNLNMNPGSGKLTGTVTQRLGAVVQAVSNIDADRAHYSTANKVPANLAGTTTKPYTLVFPAKTQSPAKALNLYPQGDGYATMTMNVNGTVSITGKLADNTPITASAPLSKLNLWPIFAQLYTMKGSIAGMAALTDANGTTEDVIGTNLQWFRPALTGVQYYPAGWPGGITVDINGARYVVPPASPATSVFPGLPAVNPTTGNATLTFTGGLLNPLPLPYNINISAANLVTNAPVAASPTMLIDKASGKITGAFIHTDGPTIKPAYQGVIIQKGTRKGGSGYFMSRATPVTGLGESGRVGVSAK